MVIAFSTILVANPTRLHQVKTRHFSFQNEKKTSQPHFTIIVDQLNQIRQASFARLICDNNDGSVTHMQPRAMRSPTGT